jgi:ABC-2 type transport system permease protein
MRGIWAIIALDLKRFSQDRVRLVTGLIQPLLYLFVLGSGLGASMNMRPMGAAMAAAAGAGAMSNAGDYRSFIFPGVISLALLFAATFAAITIVFDRQIGFFKAVLVSPVARPAIAVGKVVAGALQALAQGFLLMCFLPFLKIHPGWDGILLAIPAMILAALTFSAMGVAMASRFTSTTVFPIMTNAIILPMFFLSGAMYPLQPAPGWMKTLAHLDPVAYAVDLVRGALLGREHMFFGSPWLCIAVLVVFITVLTWSAMRVFVRGEELDLTGPTQFSWRR